MSMCHYSTSEYKIPWWKRPFDIMFSLIIIFLFLPFILLISLLIKLTDKGPVFFLQERVGLKGKSFKIIKFRTMYLDGEKILNEYLNSNPKAQEEWRKYRKLKSYDPRVTPVGRFLRKWSLDEIPQFINVLKGNMSVVGPRPYIYKEFHDYNIPEDIIQILTSVKPGITGLWQVSKRNEATFEERVKMDMQYIKSQSFVLDMKIILKTIWIVLTGKGAY